MWVPRQRIRVVLTSQPWRPTSEHLVEDAKAAQNADAARASKEVGGEGRTREVRAIEDQGSPAGGTEQGRQRRAGDPRPHDDDIHLPGRDHAAFLVPSRNGSVRRHRLSSRQVAGS